MNFISIKQSAEFNRVFKNGVKVLTPFFVLYFLVDSCPISEFGIIAAKKQFPKAVDRNFCKRRIRAAIRKLPELRHNARLVVVCRKKCLNSTFQEIYKALETAL
jgi:ribonuclease P protein component